MDCPRLRTQHTLALFSMGCLLTAMIGCGGGGAANTHKVTGKVTTADGAAAKGLNVSFQPVSKGFGATGNTGEDGAYTLSTFGEGDGAAEGEYNVAVNTADGQQVTLTEPKQPVAVKAGSNTIDLKVGAIPAALPVAAEPAAESGSK